MRPDTLLLLLSLSSLLLHPLAALCVPRTSEHAVHQQIRHNAPAKRDLPPGPSPKASHPAAPVQLPSLSVPDAPIKALCARTRYPDVCEPAVKSNIRMTGSVDAKAALLAAMDAASARTKAVQAVAARLAADPKTDSMDKPLVNGCVEQYDSALYDLKTAAEALAQKDLPTAKSNLDAFITDVETCEDGFDEVPRDSLMASYDDELETMGSVILDLYGLVE